MISGPAPAARTPRAPQTKAPAAGDAAPAEDPAQERALEIQRQTFDIELQEQAELEREREALEQLMLARLKDEDEIVKKMIAMI
jgi:hypothetical protein